MSEALPRSTSEVISKSDREAYFEQRIFVVSPFGLLSTCVLILALFVGSFAALAWLNHVPLASAASGGAVPTHVAKFAFLLSLLLTTALGMQRYDRVKDRADAVAHPSVFRHGLASVDRFADFRPTDARLVSATLAGALLGLGVSYVFLRPSMASQPAAVVAWFVVVVTLLCMSFVRGVELTRSGARSMQRIIDEELPVDILRIDRLSIVGRTAARMALTWFAISAVACLLLVGGEITAFTIFLLAGCVGMGVFIFVRTMGHVHRKIRTVKMAELDHVRRQIDEVRRDAHIDADAAMRLQGLLAYETRIEATHEWPFDQTTAVRFGASTLVLAVPWVGRVIGNMFLEHLPAWIR